MTASLGTVLASGSYRGAWQGFLWGSYSLVVAVYDGSKTRVYRSTNSTSWTELTAGSGAFGDTRLTGNGPVSFTVVPNPFSLPTAVNTERFLFTDGTGAIRAVCNDYEQGGVTDGTACTLNAITAPSVGQLPVRVRAIESTLLNLQGTPSFTVPSSGEFNFAASGSAPNKVARLTIDPSIDIDDYVSVTVGSSSLSVTTEDRQVLIGVDTAYTMLWDKLKVELGSVTLWDPSNSSSYSPPVAVTLDASNRTVWVFQYPHITASGALSGELKFTWKAAAAGEAPSSAVTADIFLLAITYGVGAYSDWSVACTMASSSSLCESPGVVYSTYVTDRISDYGGPILNGLRLPRSPVIKAQFSATYKQPSTTERDAGVDLVRWYVRQPGMARYRYMGSTSFSSVSGSTWSFDSGSAYSEKVDGVIEDDIYGSPEVYLPDAFNIPPPAAKCIHFDNDRLFAGGASGATKNLYISEAKNPFRMRRFTAYQDGRVDADAPVTRTIGGGVFQGIVSMASSLIGANQVFIFTSEGVFATGGTLSGQLQQVARVSEFGTVSPMSIAKLNGKIFYLDTEMQVRVIDGGQPKSITRSWVDDSLAGIPAARRAYVGGAVFGENYYLTFTPTGETTNTRILVWDDESGQWVVDAPPVATEGLIAWFDGTNIKKRLIAFGSASSNLNAYEYDLSTQTQDLGTTNITCAITLPAIHFDDGKGFAVGRIGVTCDDVASGTGTVVVTYMPTGSTSTRSISLDGSGNQIVRYDGTPTLSGAGNGVGAQVRLSLGLTAGKRVYKIVGEIEPRNHAYDR